MGVVLYFNINHSLIMTQFRMIWGVQRLPF